MIYDSAFDDNTIAASTEDASYLAGNLQNIHLTQVWRSTDASAQSIVIDAGSGSTITADSIVIAAHNLSASAEVIFQMHTANSWDTPDLSATVTWREGIIVWYFTSTAKRYARFYFHDPTNTDEYIEAGRLAMGAYLAIDPASLSEFDITNERTDQIDDSVSNQMYADEGVGYRVFKYKFPQTNYTMFAKMRTLYDTVGHHTPFFFMNFDSRFTEIEPAYVRLTSTLKEKVKDNMYFEYDLTMRETG